MDAIITFDNVINFEAHITFDNVKVSDLSSDLFKMKVLMLKGEKGDAGAGGSWGNIDGDITDQTDLIVLLSDKADADEVYTKTQTDSLLSGKSDTSHTHDDRYYTESETDSLLSGKSDTSHTHDDRYYTESETDTLLSGKSNTNHTHDDRYYTETETDTLLSDKADADDVYTKTQTDTLLSGKSDTSHTHDDRYYTETETDTLLSGKSNTNHTHDDRYYTETETDALLSDKADAADVVPITGGAFTGDVTFEDVVDVVQRRCYATKNISGWHRAIKLDFTGNPNGEAFIMDIMITRSAEYDSSAWETHSIRLCGNPITAVFCDEMSKTSALYVTKVRLTHDGNGIYYVDFYTISTDMNTYAVNFNVGTQAHNQQKFTAESLQAVNDAPSGETILSQYTFTAITGTPSLYSRNAGLSHDTTYVTDHNIRIRVYGKIAIVSGWIRLASEPAQTVQLITGLPQPTDDINVMYYDQNNNSFGTLYISVRNGVWCLNTGGYSQSGHIGHYLNISTSYIVTDDFFSPI